MKASTDEHLCMYKGYSTRITTDRMTCLPCLSTVSTMCMQRYALSDSSYWQANEIYLHMMLASLGTSTIPCLSLMHVVCILLCSK